MALSKESEELAEMKYDLAVQKINKSYREKQRQIEFFTLTNFRRDQEVVKLLPPRLEETADALLDCYFERFVADVVIPDQSDRRSRIEDLRESSAAGLVITRDHYRLASPEEIEGLEKQAQKKLKVRAQEMKLGVPD